MKRTLVLAATAAAVGAFAPPTLADGRNPGSVLIFPVHRSGNASQKIILGEGGGKYLLLYVVYSSYVMGGAFSYKNQI